MGQYFRGIIFNEDNTIKKTYCIYSYKTKSKLIEHYKVSNYYIDEYIHQLGNDYFGCKFAWVGDYADNSYYEESTKYLDKICANNAEKEGYIPQTPNKFSNFYIHKELHFLKNYQEFTEKTPIENLSKYRYLINLDKKQYIDLSLFNEGDIHPLPILCSDGNGKSDSDYDGTNMKYVGKWAYNHIGASNEIPENYNEFKIKFTSKDK